MREGRIRAVMETWPVQLILDGARGAVPVQLPEDSVVRRADGSPAALHPGMLIRIRGAEVTVLDEDAVSRR